MNDAYLLIGGNVGNRLFFINESAIKIEKYCGNIIKRSSIYETQAWGKTQQNPFLNQVLKISTAQTPQDLLKKIQEIENDLGRIRDEKYGERTIDIDILYFENKVISLPSLTIPHPRISQRKFVLVPLAEIANKYIDPVHEKSIEKLLELCEDKLMVSKFNGPV